MDTGRLEAEWSRHRPAVFGVGYRLLGTVADAEDVVDGRITRIRRVLNPAKLSHMRSPRRLLGNSLGNSRQADTGRVVHAPRMNLMETAPESYKPFIAADRALREGPLDATVRELVKIRVPAQRLHLLRGHARRGGAQAG